MKVETLLDQIELELIATGKQRLADRMILLKHLRYDLDVLLTEEEWDWAHKYLDPIIQTDEGIRDYVLPADFGDNFARGAGDVGADYLCKVSDGESEVVIGYESPAQFYSRDLEAEDNAKPSHYTVTTNPLGRRQISLSPPPDSNSDSQYTILGLYLPNTWDLHLESDLPPIPKGADILKWAVLRRYDPRYEQQYGAALAKIYMNAARQRKTRMIPNDSRLEY